MTKPSADPLLFPPVRKTRGDWDVWKAEAVKVWAKALEEIRLEEERRKEAERIGKILPPDETPA